MEVYKKTKRGRCSHCYTSDSTIMTDPWGELCGKCYNKACKIFRMEGNNFNDVTEYLKKHRDEETRAFNIIKYGPLKLKIKLTTKGEHHESEEPQKCN